ncbi:MULTISPECIES: ABC transporter ATP-binding protein [unclassified Adlercreutzia]|uniref:ABC transporter ATP-binding protein n=1 Tax=unclassified Adlercreutzia TaxID=2636013 RepID=UPI0013EA80CA|nr:MULTISPECIES: ABC transporter ATP-binding protein [unclassified Adlercreutzia]
MYDLVRVENLAKEYPGFALDRVSLSVPAGCVTGFIGSNGAGKTTTIKAILGLIRPSAGNVALFGELVCGFTEAEDLSTDSKNMANENGAAATGGASSANPATAPAPASPAGPAPQVHDAALVRAKARIGVVFDTCPFPSELCVSDVERVGRFAFPTWERGVFERYARQFDLDAKKRVKELSRGMGMKLQLAFALAHAPELLILDEVTAGLDPMARDEVLDILRAFMADERRGILMSSHITSDLEKIADYAVCIDKGRVMFDCAVDAICDIAGVARCGAEQARAIVESGTFAPGSLRVMAGAYAHEVLVPDRALLSRRFPKVACERVGIEDYMRLMLKGEAR